MINSIQKALFKFSPPISSVRSSAFRGLGLENHLRGGKGNKAIGGGGGAPPSSTEALFSSSREEWKMVQEVKEGIFSGRK